MSYYHTGGTVGIRGDRPIRVTAHGRGRLEIALADEERVAQRIWKWTPDKYGQTRVEPRVMKESGCCKPSRIAPKGELEMLITREEKANARKNIQRYKWARDILVQSEEKAGRWVALSDEALWQLPTEQSIPRGIHVNKEHGCPHCREGIDRFGNYPWQVDVVHDPWKTRCPNCAERYPKNDFSAYYGSGKGPDGLFRRELADGALLFNADHPDPDDPLHTFGVDDTSGWTDEKGHRYRFIGYYGHFGVWTAVSDALSALSQAHVLTGKPAYAHKALILLARIADLYPDMDYHFWAAQGFENSDGLSGQGKIFGCIWEAFLVCEFSQAYDAIRDGLDDGQEGFNTLNADTFLSEKEKRFGLFPQGNARDLNAHIETRILRQIEPAILRRDIRINEPLTQLTMATAAVVLDDPAQSDRMLDWVFAPRFRNGPAEEGIWNPGDCGHLPELFAGRIDRDGTGSEAAPGYNFLWLSGMIDLDDILSKRPSYTRHHISRDFPKFREMFRAPARLICLGAYTPNIGDTGSTGSPGRNVATTDLYVKAFERFGDLEFAQNAYWLNGNTTKGLHSIVFHPEPEQIAEQVKQIIARHGPKPDHSDVLDGYGLAILRDGEGENRRAAWIYYGRNKGHGHLDTANLGLYAHGLDLMPDLGYPEYASAWPKRYGWTHHTVSHNTVMVDRTPQHPSYSGALRLFGNAPAAQGIEIESRAVYPQCTHYRRSILMVKSSPTDSYLVDLFRVEGGEEHHFSFHGPEGTVSTEGLDLIPQSQGTYAGRDVAFGTFYDEPFDISYRGSGFQYLYNVQRCAAPEEQFSVDWHAQDTWRVLKGSDVRDPDTDTPSPTTDVHLRWTMLDPPGEVALCHGDPPRNKPGNPRRLQYAMVKSTGTPASTGFLSVIEPYRRKAMIRSIEEVSVEPNDEPGTQLKARALKITLTAGRVDYLMFSLDPDRLRRIDGRIAFRGSIGFYSEVEGGFRSAMLINGTQIGPEEAGDCGSFLRARRSWTGTVAHFEQGGIHTKDPLPTDGSLTGQWILVANDNERDACYRIRGTRKSRGETVIEVGDGDFVRAMVDDGDYSRGYLYEIARGHRFEIPLCACWEAGTER
ncbi:MAG: heparinase II/III family protein [Candidatus Latescibacterota bacterium]